MTPKSLTVFAYSFPHKKTYDFLTMLFVKGFRNVVVVGAPKVKLRSNGNQKKYFDSVSAYFPKIECSELCEMLGFKFLECPHSDAETIRKFVETHTGNELAIISGARILDQKIIEIFEKGIINFHPGSIPETSGLDSFYWMIKRKSLPGTTIHYIDKKVDAGALLYFQHAEISDEDTPATLQVKLYNSQLEGLSRLLDMLKASYDLSTMPIDRPFKNLPMSSEQKEAVLSSFGEWKSQTVELNRCFNEAIDACTKDDIAKLQKSYSDSFLNRVTNQGWNLLSISAFNQSENCIKFLLDKGFNINWKTVKGTTVFMYAKTASVNSEKRNIEFLSSLISQGVDVYQKDMFGKDVFNYIEEAGDSELASIIKGL